MPDALTRLLQACSATRMPLNMPTVVGVLKYARSTMCHIHALAVRTMWHIPVLVVLHVCKMCMQVCGQEGAKACAACRTVAYCGKDCQTKVGQQGQWQPGLAIYSSLRAIRWTCTSCLLPHSLAASVDSSPSITSCHSVNVIAHAVLLAMP